MVRFSQVGNRFFESGDALIDFIEMLSADLNLNGLATAQFITDYGGYNIICLVLCFFKKQGFTVFGVKYLTGQDIVNDGGR